MKPATGSSLPKKLNLKVLKRLNRKDYRIISLVVLPALAFLVVFLFIDSLIMPSIVAAIITFIIAYFWGFFKEVFSASLIGIISFIIITLLFFTIVVLLIRYNSGDIEWGVNVFEMFGLDK